MTHELVILVIEDEGSMRRFLRASLSDQPYKVLEATTGAEGLAMAASQTPGVVLLDLGLPDMEGIDVARRLREWSKSPIIVLSARGQEQDKVAALDAGADDYLTKPFAVGELLARIRVAQRHLSLHGEQLSSEFVSGDLRVDLAKRQVFAREKEVHLTPTEYKLLNLLIQNAGRVVTHQQLLKEGWGVRYATQRQYLHVHMGNLRAKIEEQSARPKLLLTEPGIGYRLKGP